MKKIICELCECTEFTKENGFFVCHGCGTRYTLAEARGLLHDVEGPVPIMEAVVTAQPSAEPGPEPEESFGAQKEGGADALYEPEAEAAEPVAAPEPEMNPVAEPASVPSPGCEQAPAPAEPIPAAFFEDTMPESEAEASPLPAPDPVQEQIVSKLSLAAEAVEARNYRDGEALCNEILTLDPSCSEAFFLKARAIGWQSRIGALRLDAAAALFRDAISSADPDAQEAVKERAVAEMKKLGLALVALRRDRFSKQSTSAELAGYLSDKDAMLKSLGLILEAGSRQPLPESYCWQISAVMNQAAVSAYNKTRSDWQQLAHPSREDWNAHIESLGSIEELLRQAILLSPNDDGANLTRYQNLIVVTEAPCSAWAWQQGWNANKGCYEWQRSWRLSDSAIAERKNTVAFLKVRISELQSHIKEKEEAAAKQAEADRRARVIAYWQAHPEQKAAIDDERMEANQKRNILKKEIAALDYEIENARPSGLLPAEQELNALHTKLSGLMAYRSQLAQHNSSGTNMVDENIARVKREIEVYQEKVVNERNAQNSSANVLFSKLCARRAQLSEVLEATERQLDALTAAVNTIPEQGQ